LELLNVSIKSYEVIFKLLSLIFLIDLKNREVFEKLQPPLLYLPSYDQVSCTNELKKYHGLPCLEFPVAVANYFALAVELKVKVTISALIKKITANTTSESKYVITMDTIQEAYAIITVLNYKNFNICFCLRLFQFSLSDGTLNDFPWDKPHVMRDCRFHYLERNIKRIRPEHRCTSNDNGMSKLYIIFFFYV
jgi:hypothetical protein